MDGQAFGIPHIRQVREQLQMVDELFSAGSSGFESEHHHAAEPVFKLGCRGVMGRIVWQARVSDPCNGGMGQPGTGLVAWAFSQCCFMRSPRVSMPWRNIHALSGLMQAPRLRSGPHPHPQDEGQGVQVPEIMGKPQIMVGRVRVIVQTESGIGPVKGAAVHGNAAQGRAVPPPSTW